MKSLHAAGHIQCSERSTSVLHILRGGLTFGLREALGGAFAWNAHGASFLSAQRERLPESPTEWRIVEDSYQKVYLEEVQTVVFGDVVATGTSLEHALQALLEHVVDQKAPLREIVFFTIGGNRSTTLLKEYGEKFRSAVGSFESCSVIYLEGIFAVPDTTTPLRIKIDGTDLLRRDSILAPEFVESQYEKPQYALERCTIYDAGSRAFHIPEYLEDLREYWEAIAQHAASGVGYAELVEERMPELDLERLGRHDLYEIAQLQLARITQNS